MRRAALAPLLFAWLAAPGLAAAQSEPFVMPDLDGRSWVGTELALGETATYDARVVTLTAVIDYAVAPNLVVRARIPMTRAHGGAALGEVAVGGRLIFPPGGRARPTWAIYAETSLPTLTGFGDEYGPAAALAATYHAPHERWLSSGFGAGCELRLARPGRFGLFVQGKLGLLVTGPARLFDLGVAFGVDVAPRLSLVAELSSVVDVLDESSYFGPGNRSNSSVDFGPRWRRGRLTLAGRGYVQFDPSAGGDRAYGLGVDLRWSL